MALRDGNGGVATVELLELARDGTAVQGLGQQQHTLLQRAQLRHAGVTLYILIRKLHDRWLQQRFKL